MFPADFLEHALNETVTLKRVQSSIHEASLLLARAELTAHEQTFVQVAREFKWTDDYFTALSVAVEALHAYSPLAHSASQNQSSTSSSSSAAKEEYATFEALMAAWDDWSNLLDTIFLPDRTARADARMEQVLCLSQCEPDAVWHTFWQWAYWAAKGHALYQKQELPALLYALQPLMNNSPQSEEKDAQRAACQNAFRRLMRWLSLPPSAAQTTREPLLLLTYLHHVRTKLATSEPPL
jgi:hypothetical protein